MGYILIVGNTQRCDLYYKLGAIIFFLFTVFHIIVQIIDNFLDLESSINLI
jgi:hypothetical protein